MYPTSYGRFSVTDNVCNTQLRAGRRRPARRSPVTATTKAQSFALANGTANGTPASMVYNDSVGGPRVVEHRHLGVDRRAGLRPRQRALPARARHRRRRDRRGAHRDRQLDAADGGAERRGARRHRRGAAERQPARQADRHRRRPQRRARPGQQQLARLRRLQQGPAKAPPARLELHRGRQRAALRHLHPVQRLRQSLRAAARLLRAGDGRDVRAPQERHGAAAEPGGAGDAARRRRRARRRRSRRPTCRRSAPRRRRPIRSASSAPR